MTTLREIYNGHMGSDYNPTKELDLSTTEMVYAHLFHGNLLEVGCGNGRLGLTLLADKSIDSVTFLDVADVCIEYVKIGIRKFGLDSRYWGVVRSTLEDFPLNLLHYDTIAFFEGLEHVIDVKVAVDKIYSLLKEGGIFIGSVPVGMACNHHTHLHHFYEGDIQAVLSPVFSTVEVQTILVNEEFNEYHYIFKVTR